MSATLYLTGTLRHPRNNRIFVIAGHHSGALFGRIREEPFSFQLIKPDKLPEGTRPGDVLRAEIHLQPLRGEPGNLLLIPREVQRLSPADPERSRTDTGYIYPYGEQRVVLNGTLAEDPVTTDFGNAGLHVTVPVDVNGKGDLVNIVINGEAAYSFQHRKQGDRITTEGTLFEEHTLTPNGQSRGGYVIRVGRTDIEDAAAFQERLAEMKKRRTRQNRQKSEPTADAAAPKAQNAADNPSSGAPKTSSKTPQRPGALKLNQNTAETAPEPAPLPDAPAPTPEPAPVADTQTKPELHDNTSANNNTDHAETSPDTDSLSQNAPTQSTGFMPMNPAPIQDEPPHNEVQ